MSRPSWCNESGWVCGMWHMLNRMDAMSVLMRVNATRIAAGKATAEERASILAAMGHDYESELSKIVAADDVSIVRELASMGR